MKKSQFKQQLLFTKDVEQITGFNRVTLRNLLVFIVPPELVKNGDERLIVCNEKAKRQLKASGVDMIPTCLLSKASRLAV